MIPLEVRDMDMKAILRKSFARYGIIGICTPSWRGCHEPTVPTALVEKFAFRSVSVKKQISTRKNEADESIQMAHLLFYIRSCFDEVSIYACTR